MNPRSDLYQPGFLCENPLSMRLSSPIYKCLTLGLLASLACLGYASSGSTDSTLPEGKPRLAVLLVFDQMRGDYLTRWEKLYTDKGFRRVMRDGAWFDNCHYPYAHTVTGAGHASLMTGCSPEKHGIVGNEWFDRASGKEIGCVASDRYQQVPLLAKKDGITAVSAVKWMGAS